jgi:alpha-tubulin suppressor-like RCC1 family protein
MSFTIDPLKVAIVFFTLYLVQFKVLNAQNCFKIVSAAQIHSAAIKDDGTLWTWGRNDFGRLGDGTNTQRISPVQIGNDSNWLTVSAGLAYTVALKTDGSLWAWGQNYYGQLGDGTTIDKYVPVQIGIERNWVSVSAGWSHTVAVRTDGSIWIWPTRRWDY